MSSAPSTSYSISKWRKAIKTHFPCHPSVAYILDCWKTPQFDWPEQVLLYFPANWAQQCHRNRIGQTTSLCRRMLDFPFAIFGMQIDVWMRQFQKDEVIISACAWYRWSVEVYTLHESHTDTLRICSTRYAATSVTLCARCACRLEAVRCWWIHLHPF